MSSPEILVKNEISAGVFKEANAILLTPELEEMIRNQNIDTKDINSMKWPLFGLSRHAVCKLLMLRSDTMKLLFSEDEIPETVADRIFNQNQYQIIFRCTDDENDKGQVFPRMHMCKVTPLLVTANGYLKSEPQTDENGDPVLDQEGNQVFDELLEGEALYIVEFRCDRWWWSSYRTFDYSENIAEGSIPGPTGSYFHGTWVESHNKGLMPYSTYTFSNQLIETFLKSDFRYGKGLGQGDGNNVNAGLFRNISDQDEFIDTFSTLLVNAASGNFDRNRPLVEVIDEICREALHAISYKPSDIFSNFTGKFRFEILNFSLPGGKLTSFLNRHGDDVIAGAINTDGDQTIPTHSLFNNPEAQGWSSRWPRIICMDPLYKSIHHTLGDFVIAHRASIPDGRPPRVFHRNGGYDKITAYGETTYSLHNVQSTSLPDIFSEHHPHDIVRTFSSQPDGNIRPRFIHLKKFPSAYIDTSSSLEVTKWQQRNREDGDSWLYTRSAGLLAWYELDWSHLNSSSSASRKPLNPSDEVQFTNAQHYLFRQRTEHSACDLWLNKWWMPADDEIWPGVSWIELRLQTDRDGFGFPTTRAWSDPEDPIFCSVADDKPLDIRATGLAKAWRDSDGKTRVHVPWPFGIPCLIKIIGLYDTQGTAGQFNSNVKAWTYKAKIMMKGQGSGPYKRYPPHPNDALEYMGQLVNWCGSETTPSGNDYDYIAAYNLAELANTTTFSAPGYKMPIAQAGFDVLPIGKDRDGAFHEVIVQAMVYMSDNRYPPDPASDKPDVQIGQDAFAYFCLSNAVDGECPVPLTQETFLDGGEY